MNDKASKEEMLLNAHFGAYATAWPKPSRTPPSIWNRKAIRHEKPIRQAMGKVLGKAVITKEMREVFWRNIDFGQGAYEDAGGYYWRCWAAMLGLPYKEPISPDEVLRQKLVDGLKACPVCGGKADLYLGPWGERQARCSVRECGSGLPGDMWQTTWPDAVAAWNDFYCNQGSKKVDAKYMLFAGDQYYAHGGYNDFVGVFDTIEAAKEAGEKTETLKLSGDYALYDWYHIVLNNEIVFKSDVRPYGSE